MLKEYRGEKNIFYSIKCYGVTFHCTIKVLNIDVMCPWKTKAQILLTHRHCHPIGVSQALV